MRRGISRTVGAAVAAALVSVVALPPAAPAQDETVYSRTFKINRVDTRVAETWVWELCAELADQKHDCRVAGVNEGDVKAIHVSGTSAVHARVARLLAERDAGIPRTRTFKLTLVAAGTGGAGIEGELGDEARAALEDLRQLLPFRRFEVLDTVLISTSRRGLARFTGPDGLSYKAVLDVYETESVDGPVLEIRRFEIEGEVIREQGVPAAADPQPNEQPPSRYKSFETVLSTSLSMAPGETAVVGTSKLDGGEEALVVLLTALP